MYDPQLGRFTGIDPIAEDFYYVSPYNYAENSPIANIDWWELQAVFFQKGLEKNEGFQKTYKAQRNTTLGKEFSNKLSNQNKYNALYFTYDYPYYDGSLTSVDNMKTFKSKKSYNGDLMKLDNSEVKKALEDGKELLLIGVRDIKDTKEGVYEAAKTLNHEEGAHGIDYLDNGVNDNSSDEDHDRYYGTSGSKDGISPNDSEVENNPEFKGSPAKENYDQLKEMINKIIYKPPGKHDDIDRQY